MRELRRAKHLLNNKSKDAIGQIVLDLLQEAMKTGCKQAVKEIELLCSEWTDPQAAEIKRLIRFI